MNSIDVIIAVKDRAEIALCVQSLLPVQNLARIIICDGGSSDLEAQKALQTLEQYSRVCIFRCPIAGFNKAFLLNQGILKAASTYVLISDADILWNAVAVEALSNLVQSQTETIYYIQNVQESIANSIALQRDRYTYQIRHHAEIDVVEILPVQPQIHDRPGCGLICARRETLLKLGGYKECFQGWGWEDQDLLIRANLLGIQVGEVGEVTHLSHTDEKRNRYCNNLKPSQTRDRNIVACLHSLAQGKLWGDLQVEAIEQIYSNQIAIQLPDSLKP